MKPSPLLYIRKVHKLFVSLKACDVTLITFVLSKLQDFLEGTYVNI